VTGAKDATFQDEFITTAGAVRCTTPSYHGTVSNSTTTVTVTPTYGGCTAFGFPATIHHNGCVYIFHVNGGSSTEGTVSLDCPGTNELTVTAIGAGTVKCTVHVPEQPLTSKVIYTEVAPGDITVDVTVEKIKYTHTAGTGVGACTSGGGETGTLKAKGIVAGAGGVGLDLSAI
jgi:hypothetical protein